MPGPLTSLQSLRAEPVPRRATGPTTDEGKAISSQNAFRHGMSAAPPTDQVRAWFNVILNKDAGSLEEPNADDPRRDAALRLALAEVRYHRALQRLGTHAVDSNCPKFRAGELHAEMRQALAYMAGDSPDGRPNMAGLDYAISVLHHLERLASEASREVRLCLRYLGEARAQRRKALRDWCALNGDQNSNSKNELKICF
jgi:hypothetical protein